MIKYILVVSFLLIGLAHGQNTLTIAPGIVVNWRNIGAKTVFNVSAELSGGVSVNDAWLGIGLNVVPRMAGLNAVICRYSASTQSVQSNVNSAFNSKLFDETNPTFGLSDTSVSVRASTLYCNYARDNSNSITTSFFEITPTSQYYLLAAWGSGNLGFHGDNVAKSSSAVSFPLSSSTVAPETTSTSALPSTTTSNATGTTQPFNPTGSTPVFTTSTSSSFILCNSTQNALPVTATLPTVTSSTPFLIPCNSTALPVTQTTPTFTTTTTANRTTTTSSVSQTTPCNSTLSVSTTTTSSTAQNSTTSVPLSQEALQNLVAKLVNWVLCRIKNGLPLPLGASSKNKA